MPCQYDGSYLRPGKHPRPPPIPATDPTDWGAFKSKHRFKMAELLYSKARMSEGNIDTLLQLWNNSGNRLPFSGHRELLTAIDEIPVGDTPWHSFLVRYNSRLDGANHSEPQTKWMLDAHEVFYRDPRLVLHQMLANPDFKDGMDFSPYRVFDKDGARQYQHLMSGDWAWDQAVSPYHALLARFFSSVFECRTR
jgi:hypothetical protein